MASNMEKKAEKLILYETEGFLYLVGFDTEETAFRMMKMDRRIKNPKSLADILMEDPITYSKQSLMDMLALIHEGNKATGT